MTPLRQQMTEDMIARGLAKGTQETYLHAVAELARFHGRSPDLLTPREVQRFLIHLAEERGFAHGTCNSYAHGLRFFYRITLGQEAARFQIPRTSKERRLPEVLSRAEVSSLIEAAASLRDRALLTTTYMARACASVR